MNTDRLTRPRWVPAAAMLAIFAAALAGGSAVANVGQDADSVSGRPAVGQGDGGSPGDAGLLQ